MKCPACQAENRVGAKFCARCGHGLPEAPAPLPEPAVTEPAAATPPAEEAEPAAPTPEEAVESAAVAEAGEEAPQAAEAAATPTEAAPAPVAEPAAPAAEPSPDAPATDAPATDAPAAATPAAAAPAAAAALACAANLAAGALLADRYEIIGPVEGEPCRYRAFDLRRCPQCGYAKNEPRSEFCAECGATWTEPVQVIIHEQKATAEPAPADQFLAGGYVYTVTVEPSSATQGAASSLSGLQLTWGQKTDVGKQREVNEDSVDVRVYTPHAGPVLGSFIVADGVGGQDHGEVASQMAVQVIWQQVRERIWGPEMAGEPVPTSKALAILAEAVQAANETVYKLRTAQASEMGTTVSMALLRDNLAIIANVGDSRTYLWSSGGLKRLTTDHSVVETLVAAGRITRAQVYSHPQRNLIYRSLGDRSKVEVDTFTQALAPGDRLLLCSDGLWEMARDEGIEEVLLSEANPQRACDQLVEMANLAGGDDNITVIIVQVA